MHSDIALVSGAGGASPLTGALASTIKAPSCEGRAVRHFVDRQTDSTQISHLISCRASAGVMTMTTRRFCWRPRLVALDSIGSFSPIPMTRIF